MDGKTVGLAATGCVTLSQRRLSALDEKVAADWPRECRHRSARGHCSKFVLQRTNRIQGDYLRAFSDRMQSIPIPATSLLQQSIVKSLVPAVIQVGDPRLEQLINGLVYELFFPDT